MTRIPFSGVGGWGACMAGGLGACVAGGMHGRGYAWQGVCVAGGIHGRIKGHCSRWYASYWNAFLLVTEFSEFNESIEGKLNRFFNPQITGTECRG